MKRIYLLMLAFVVFAGNVFAQRNINLQVTLMKPTTSTVQTSGGPFQIDAEIKNLGPDSLRTTDSVRFAVTLSGAIQPIVYGNPPQQGSVWTTWNRSLKVNDTFHIRVNNTITYTQAVDSNRSVCFIAVPIFKGAAANDTIRDNPTTNNTSCVSYLWKVGNGTSVDGSVSYSEKQASIVNIYPNPANDLANVVVNLGTNAEVTVRLTDVTGRVMMQEDKGFMSKGEHTIPMNTSHLQNGLYLYQVQMGEEVSTGKLMIAK